MSEIVVTQHRTEFKVALEVLQMEDGNIARAAGIAAHRWKIMADHGTSKGLEFGTPLVEVTAPDEDGYVVIAVTTNTGMATP